MEGFWHACMNTMMGSGGLLMMLPVILLWIAVLAGVVLGLRWLLRQQAPSGHESAADPLRILERRFAAGEIEQDEFEQKRRALGAS